MNMEREDEMEMVSWAYTKKIIATKAIPGNHTAQVGYQNS